jgi:hypothetical protein
VYVQQFNKEQLSIVSDALYIAEDMTSNYYRLSVSEWKRNPFDLKTLAQLFSDDIRDNVFAVLKKCTKSEHGCTEPNGREFYLICLQDHQIIRALKRDKGLALLSLLVYILTHELVHIVRFFRFEERFDVKEEMRRLEEEQIVHRMTYEILKELSLPNLSHLFRHYMPTRRKIDTYML